VLPSGRYANIRSQSIRMDISGFWVGWVQEIRE